MDLRVDRLAMAGCAVVFALTACGSAPDSQSSGSPAVADRSESSASTEPSRVPEPQPLDREVFEFTAFRSPSGSIGCMIEPGYVRCDVAERDWSPPPRPADCEFDYGQGISIAASEPAQFVCAGDTALAPDADPLPYGEAIAAGSMRCDSAQSGISCRDGESGHGFSIAREAYRLF